MEHLDEVLRLIGTVNPDSNSLQLGVMTLREFNNVESKIKEARHKATFDFASKEERRAKLTDDIEKLEASTIREWYRQWKAGGVKDDGRGGYIRDILLKEEGITTPLCITSQKPNSLLLIMQLKH